MKILHTADMHLGVKNGKLSKEKQNLLKDEEIYKIRNFFDFAKEENFDVILICGDLFHSKNITLKLQKAFFESVSIYGKPVVYVSGNHDENFIMPEDLPENFCILDNNHNKYIYSNFAFYGENLGEEKLNEQFNNILLLHGNIENTRDADFIDINKYLYKGFDYIALGHVHQHKKYKSEKDVFAYPGTLFSNGFDESGDKGFIALEIENKNISKLEFVSFPSRKFIVCECDISDLISNKEIIAKIKEQLTASNVCNDDLVRVVLKGSINEDCDKSIPFILNSIKEYFYFEIEDKTTLKIDLNKIKKEKLSFKYEFISLIEESDFDEEFKRQVLEIGLEALKGEDINI